MGKQLETPSPMTAARFKPAIAAARQRPEDLIYARWIPMEMLCSYLL